MHSTSSDRPLRVLLVCLGNICRSPMAEGILRHMIREQGLNATTDSAGTNDFHTGEAPDGRATKAMRKHGIDISDLRARQVDLDDFHRFDLLLAMDESNLEDLRNMAPDETLSRKVKLMMDYAPKHPERSVPDPYYGGDEGFEHVFAMLAEACTSLAVQLHHHA